jgi:acyl-CoA reductase-like NAD-dependent aldehyde dehydrogenase
LFIDNHWVPPKRKNYLPVINPANKTVFHFYPAGTKEDIDSAVDAAAAAFPTWSSTDGKTRAHYINAIADEIKRRRDDIVRIEVTVMC